MDSPSLLETPDEETYDNEKIIELSIENANKVIYDEENECLELGNERFGHVVLCGYIRNLTNFQEFVQLTISDGKASIDISIYCEFRPEETHTYLQEQLEIFDDALNDSPSSYVSEEQQAEAYLLQKETLRFHSTFQSLPFIENLKIGDLLLITGQLVRKGDEFILIIHESLRIMHDASNYLAKWLQKVEKIKFD